MTGIDGRNGGVWFEGDYRTWAEACAASTGYDAPAILERVIAATRRVVAGEAVYERDAVTFDRVEYSAPLLAGLLYVASRSGNCLDLVDVGGSLGSSFRQNRHLLGHVAHLRWSVVEQPHFVAAGRAEFETDEIRFYDSINGCLRVEQPSVALLSSVLPYLEAPYAMLDELFTGPFEFVLIDRTPFFLLEQPDRLTVEHVPPEIYQASCPAWFFGRRRFLDHLLGSPFSIVVELDSWERWETGGDAAQSRFFLLERRRT